MFNAILNPLKVVGRYLIRQFDDGATERSNVLPETLSQSVTTMIQQQERDHKMLETVSNSLATMSNSLETVSNSLATTSNSFETVSNKLETVSNSLEAVIREQAKDHALLKNMDKSQAEWKQVVQSLSTILLSLLDSEINLDLDLAENPSDSKIKRLEFKKYLHEAHGLPQSGRHRDFIAAGIILGSQDTSELCSFDMATGRVLPSAIVTAAHIYQHRWRKINILTTFPPDFINDPRNGLLLYKPVEHAFDRAQVYMCIEVFSIEGQEDIFKFRLLDENLRNKALTEHAKGLPGAGDIHSGIENDFTTTFGDLDGQALHWPQTSHFRPS